MKNELKAGTDENAEKLFVRGTVQLSRTEVKAKEKISIETF